MNLTIQKTESTVPLSTLNAGDVFNLSGNKFVKLRAHPGLGVYDGQIFPIGNRVPLIFVYASLPGDTTPFTLFGSNIDFDVIPLGKLVDSDAK